MTQTTFLDPAPSASVAWAPNQAAAEIRWQTFLPKAGGRYARVRNYDYGPDQRDNVSALSPWIRHRLILETDILQAVLARHSFASAEKFLQEVFWRGYFKGWLEHRPEVWQRYRIAVRDQIDQLETDASLARKYENATSGATGIACFDAWVKELVELGYLHNHARMWFASIWIFTLKLPWELGADFFYRHLLDGDPASNTCSWRWVAGLHTKGKTYLARASNIERYTDGRFNPIGQLATEAIPLMEPEMRGPILPDFKAMSLADTPRYGLLITEEDCAAETLPINTPPHSILGLTAPTERSILPLGEPVRGFAPGAVEDAATRAQSLFACDLRLSATPDWQAIIDDWASAQKLDAIVTAHLPIGPVARRIRRAIADRGVPLIELPRAYDMAVWPHSKRGFFGLKKKIPNLLETLDLRR